MNSKRDIYLPIFIGLALAIGIFIGARFDFSGGQRAIFSMRPSPSGKISEVFEYIQDKYVDTISRQKLIDKTLTSMLQSLDPHSAYIPADEFKAVNEPLQGNFDGIGIEYNIIDDTIRVLSVFPGGPSEELGILEGDRIIKIEGKNVAGVSINNKEVLDKVRGQTGTKVNLTIQREGASVPLEYAVTRAKVPIHSVEVAYMAPQNVGYIKVNRFAFNTVDEYKKAFEKLKKNGMQKLILDLRDNPGGYLTTAVDLCDEFLESKKQVVYTEGKSSPRKTYTATEKGEWETQPLVVLIDEGSASASEIVAGAVQDNDRGMIIGRRSFGKGLVQEQVDFKDSSAIRLTIARYYTPTGRCIQRSYTKGRNAYYHEEVERVKNGEMLSKDSIRFSDTVKYITPGGKIVYGGGGIIPDVFVAADTSGETNYLNELIYKEALSNFAFAYADKERKKLRQIGYGKFYLEFNVGAKMLNDLIDYAETQGVKRNLKEISFSRNLITLELKALIARNIWKEDGYYQVINAADPAYLKALQVLK